jgi:hypothetical protein
MGEMDTDTLAESMALAEHTESEIRKKRFEIEIKTPDSPVKFLVHRSRHSFAGCRDFRYHKPQEKCLS